MPSAATSSAIPSDYKSSPAYPELELFKTKMSQAIARSGRIFGECESIFRDFLHSDFALTFLNHELWKIANDTQYVSRHIHAERITLVKDPDFNLYLKMQEASNSISPYLYGVVSDLMIGISNISEGKVIHFECFEHQDQLENPILDRTKKLVCCPERVVAQGDVVSFRAARDIYRIRPSDSPVLLLILTSRPIVSICWEFDSSTLLPRRAMSTSPEASRLEFTARLLSELGDPSSVPALKGLLQHPEHFVRWEAIRAVARIDAAEGLALLRDARNDPHPHIRNAALRELEQAAASRLHADGSPSVS